MGYTVTAKKEPKERLDRTTKLVLTNMIRARILPLIQAETKRIQIANQIVRRKYEAELAEWNKAAEPAKMAEFLKRPRIFTETNGLGGPKINEKALNEWYTDKHPQPASPIQNEETEQVYFAALTDDDRRGYHDDMLVLTVPASMVPAVQQLADAIDIAFLSGTAQGLVDAIASAAKRLGEK